MMILRDHYTDELEIDLGVLSHLSPQGWEGPFHVASIWAKRGIGRRLHRETLEQAQAHIIAGIGKAMGGEVLADPPPPSSSLSVPLPPSAVSPPSQTANDTEITPMDKHTITVEVHQTPKHSELAPTSPIPPRVPNPRNPYLASAWSWIGTCGSAPWKKG